jgi:hypothetical protein
MSMEQIEQVIWIELVQNHVWLWALITATLESTFSVWYKGQLAIYPPLLILCPVFWNQKRGNLSQRAVG